MLRTVPDPVLRSSSRGRGHSAPCRQAAVPTLLIIGGAARLTAPVAMPSRNIEACQGRYPCLSLTDARFGTMGITSTVCRQSGKAMARVG
jgi:hypothetical protein